jgi:methionyl-tRNA formyltransferase
MKLVFCGTPQFAVPTLEALIAAGHDVTLVLSQPDKPVGRAGEVHATPVKRAAQEHGIAVLQPEKLKTNEDLRAQLTALAPDAIIVVAYGRIIPQWMLDLPRFGCLNGHGSLLPRWRGAAPIQWAIASGDVETGVTTMQLNAGLDTGPMLMKWAVEITPKTTSPDLFESLSVIGAQLMVATLVALEAGTITPQPQDDALATLAPILTRDDARIDFARTAQQIDQRFRGFQPWPGAFTTLRGKKLIVHAMTYDLTTSPASPGTIDLQDGRFRVTCGEGSTLLFDEVQMEGKKRMTAVEFLRGFQLKNGEMLGEVSA